MNSLTQDQISKLVNPKCEVCDKPLSGRQERFCSRARANTTHQSYDAQQARGLDRKKKLVAALGGGCKRCGYNKNLAALVFHHTDPSKKRFSLDVRSLSNRRVEEVLKELEGCELYCLNCHAELHNPQSGLY